MRGFVTRYGGHAVAIGEDADRGIERKSQVKGKAQARIDVVDLTRHDQIRANRNNWTQRYCAETRQKEKRREEFDTSGSDPHWIPLRADTKSRMIISQSLARREACPSHFLEYKPADSLHENSSRISSERWSPLPGHVPRTCPMITRSCCRCFAAA